MNAKDYLSSNEYFQVRERERERRSGSLMPSTKVMD